jgi:hypothetical protein
MACLPAATFSACQSARGLAQSKMLRAIVPTSCLNQAMKPLPVPRFRRKQGENMVFDANRCFRVACYVLKGVARPNPVVLRIKYAVARFVCAVARAIYAVARMNYAVARKDYAVAQMNYAVARTSYAVARANYAVARTSYAVAHFVRAVAQFTRKAAYFVREVGLCS